ncbi:MAG: UDP-N-acetylmuramoyl-L-alanine--D-glutamate ligase, partial [Desulfobacteraceae bacterium]|nr:UDP-N-acetylmuramoyl-L-alanine--D-glutamate ligase [Desulfobacteraceae bacterium]
LGIKTEIGFHDSATFENAELIVVSPGVPLTIPELEKAREKGIPITGELDTVSELIDIPIVAVTGTNGKTTTTTLIGDMLKESGLNVFVCGNIGTPIVEYLTNKNKKNTKVDIIVAEISSFQLDTANKFQPDVALLLNIAEDHLDRYSNFDEYTKSKWSIFKNQTENQTAIINAKIENINSETPKIKSKIEYYNNNSLQIIEDSIFEIAKTKLKGDHNKENIAAAALATLAAKGNLEGISKGLKNFTPLPHRVEFIQSINAVDFYNDSKGTNPDAVKRAVECFDNNILLIMGGQEKDTDFKCLKNTLKTKIKKLIVMGEAKEIIANTFSDVCDGIIHATSMEDAVKQAYQNSERGDTILLSPGCASFDMYENYSKRGFDFINQVKRLEN